MADDESFSWRDGERTIRFAPGALADAPALLAAEGFAGYALLTTPRARDAAALLAADAARVLDVPHALVPEAAAALLESVGDLPLVALGGGRVVDTAKAIAATRGLRCAAIPTTLSGAPMSRTHRLPAGSEGVAPVRPSLVIADPDLMASAPQPGLTASAMNALAHGIESRYAPGANPVATLAGRAGSDLILDALSRRPEPERRQLALGALLAGYAIGSAGYSFHHVVCQTLVRVCGTPHAQTNAVLLPHSLREAQRRGLLATDAVDAEAVARAAATAGAAGLGELGVTAEGARRAAREAARRPELDALDPRPTADELLALIERAGV